MPRNQKPDSSSPDTVAEVPAPKPRSFGVNHFHLVGRMTDAGDLRQTQTGKSVLHFSIAVTAGGATMFLDLVAWEGAAENLAQRGGKGRELYVEGRIGARTREIEGHRIRQIDLVVESFQLLGRRVGRLGEGGEQATGAEAA
jgi:single-stranded DNA-binding protein